MGGTKIARSRQRSGDAPVRKEKKVSGVSTMADSYYGQLLKDSEFLVTNQRLDTELLDKLVLQLNRIYPQILNDKEAHKFRNLSVPTSVRLAELLAHLKVKGEEACHEFYRALHIHAEEVYFSLPTRVSRRETTDHRGMNTTVNLTERFVLNDRGPWFFIGCLSVAAGLALLYYCGDSKVLEDPRRVLGVTALGLGRQAKEVLISYTDDTNRKL
ncbi:caspase recruitment domain-containing protein 19-like isoform X1 [Conger conger]|uniref:caspase recruitment domain-containing protein 19-like isoform X1 n=1 Tax=Conger conger TaxID=82655 RepID=UPI002A5AB84B|nr:caspase recruitment domain-containing protein 19-like isoform X1 [Conger conger]